MEVANDQDVAIQRGLEKTYCDGNLKLQSTGEIDEGHEFWDMDHIFPVGYQAQRTVKEGDRELHYICEVHKVDDCPLFRVIALDDNGGHGVVGEGKTADAAWACVRGEVIEAPVASTAATSSAQDESAGEGGASTGETGASAGEAGAGAGEAGAGAGEAGAGAPATSAGEANASTGEIGASTGEGIGSAGEASATVDMMDVDEAVDVDKMQVDTIVSQPKSGGGEVGKKQRQKEPAPSGLDLFGLTHPDIRQVISFLPNVENVRKYSMYTYDVGWLSSFVTVYM
jgi:hypothetical protein